MPTGINACLEWTKWSIWVMRLNAEGVSTSPKKVSAVKEWLTPKNITQLRSFFGFNWVLHEVHLRLWQDL